MNNAARNDQLRRAAVNYDNQSPPEPNTLDSLHNELLNSGTPAWLADALRARIAGGAK